MGVPGLDSLKGRVRGQRRRSFLFPPSNNSNARLALGSWDQSTCPGCLGYWSSCPGAPAPARELWGGGGKQAGGAWDGEKRPELAACRPHSFSFPPQGFLFLFFSPTRLFQITIRFSSHSLAHCHDRPPVLSPPGRSWHFDHYSLESPSCLQDANIFG